MNIKAQRFWLVAQRVSLGAAFSILATGAVLAAFALCAASGIGLIEW